jgi:hypothetical protein
MLCEKMTLPKRLQMRFRGIRISHLVSQSKSVEIGDFEYWENYSDHVPLILEYNLGK